MHNQKENRISILFSGGKDSSLAALILSKIFEIKLLTANFGILNNWECAREVAGKLNFLSRFEIVKLDKEIIKKAAQMTIQDGYPNNGLKYIHKEILEEFTKYSELIADGVRRNDRVPVLSLSEITSFEDKFKVHYIQPLMGYSRKTIDILTKKYFFLKEYKSISFSGSEYEFELREFIKREYGLSKIEKIFPKDHTHSIVKALKIQIAYQGHNNV